MAVSAEGLVAIASVICQGASEPGKQGAPQLCVLSVYEMVHVGMVQEVDTWGLQRRASFQVTCIGGVVCIDVVTDCSWNELAALRWGGWTAERWLHW